MQTSYYEGISRAEEVEFKHKPTIVTQGIKKEKADSADAVEVTTEEITTKTTTTHLTRRIVSRINQKLDTQKPQFHLISIQRSTKT